jgi:hypothetical protein
MLEWAFNEAHAPCRRVPCGSSDEALLTDATRASWFRALGSIEWHS